jgi:hypothetical protein
VYQVDHRVVRGNGELRWVHERAEVVRDAAGKAARLVGVVQDITARKEAEEQLLHLAHYDKLTELPNRTLFHDRLLQSLAHSRHAGRAAAVIIIDLDHFKLINDTVEAGRASTPGGSAHGGHRGATGRRRVCCRPFRYVCRQRRRCGSAEAHECTGAAFHPGRP